MGWLRYSDGYKKRFPGNKPDRFSLGDLLRAANTTLEDISDGKENQTESMRFRGLELMIKIDYRNRGRLDDDDGGGDALWLTLAGWGGGWSIPRPSYEITVRRIPFAEYKITEVSYTPASPQGEPPRLKERRLVNRFGVKLHVTQTGQISRFSWNALVMEIVAGLTLLSIAQLIVDNVAYYIHPQNKAIEQVVYEEFEEDRWRRWTKAAQYLKEKGAVPGAKAGAKSD